MEFNTQILIDKTVEILDGMNASIKGDLDSKGISNTGEARDSIRVEVDGLTVRSLGVDYLEFLNRGRGPGKYPPPSNLVEWVRSKLGITENAESVAFLIGRKIAEQGTGIFNNRSKGIELEDKIGDVKDKISDMIPALVKEQLTIGLNKYMKAFQMKANQNNNINF